MFRVAVPFLPPRWRRFRRGRWSSNPGRSRATARSARTSTPSSGTWVCRNRSSVTRSSSGHSNCQLEPSGSWQSSLETKIRLRVCLHWAKATSLPDWFWRTPNCCSDWVATNIIEKLRFRVTQCKWTLISETRSRAPYQIIEIGMGFVGSYRFQYSLRHQYTWLRLQRAKDAKKLLAESRCSL